MLVSFAELKLFAYLCARNSQKRNYLAIHERRIAHIDT